VLGTVDQDLVDDDWKGSGETSEQLQGRGDHDLGEY
jgi:hypothetical protein